MKPYAPGERLTLSDATGTAFGTVDVDAVESGLVLGTFRPGTGFAGAAELFRQFEEHVEAAALAVLPEIERRIAALGLRIGRAGEASVPTDDVQIYSDGGFSCRPVVPVGENGTPAHRSTTTA
jgi:hypothetical protein